MSLQQTIQEMLHKSEMATDILTIAFALQEEENYTKEDAIKELMGFLEKHDLFY